MTQITEITPALITHSYAHNKCITETDLRLFLEERSLEEVLRIANMSRSAEYGFEVALADIRDYVTRALERLKCTR